MRIDLPLRLGTGLNAREHHAVRARRVKAEREAVAWVLASQLRPKTPCTFTITRVAPSNGLDSDNLIGACKACRDSIAEWMGVNDRREDIVGFVCKQERGPWRVRIESP